MATIEVSEGLAEQLKLATDKAVREELMHLARAFIDIRDADDPSPKLIHALTGKVLTVKGEWES